MNEDDIFALKRAEESRRERHWDARLKWQVLQNTITWAERQHNVLRNTRTACLREQLRKNTRRVTTSSTANATI